VEQSKSIGQVQTSIAPIVKRSCILRESQSNALGSFYGAVALFIVAPMNIFEAPEAAETQM